MSLSPHPILALLDCPRDYRHVLHSGIPGVRAAYSVTGVIDVIALIEVSDHGEVARVVTDGISKLPGVQKTETHISFRTYSPRDIDAGFSLGN